STCFQGEFKSAVPFSDRLSFIVGNDLPIAKADKEDHDLRINRLAHELDAAVTVQEVGAPGMEGVKALNVGAIDRARTAADRVQAVVGVAPDPLIAIGFISPGVPGDVEPRRTRVIRR